ncbi:MAG TPA: septum formation initiator family protein [Pseudonocardiaceae bacterium]|nr:septum formation initiator family protein [Pseudonocardiaceae bacterium]
MGRTDPTRRDGAHAGSVPVRPLGVRIGHAVGITSGRRTAMLAVVICVLMLSMAVPLRNYLSQRAELAAVREQQQILIDKIAELERRQALLRDPAHIETQARERLRYIRPGEAPYLVQIPPGGTATTPVGAPQAVVQPWYGQLWKSINSA